MSHLIANMPDHTSESGSLKGRLYPDADNAILAQNIFGFLEATQHGEEMQKYYSRTRRTKPALKYLKSHCSKEELHLSSPIYR